MFTVKFIISIVLSYTILLPLAWKWEIGKNIVVPAAAIIGIFSWLTVSWVNLNLNLSIYIIVPLQIIVILSTAASLILWRFFRDPVRNPPDMDNIILSPADGKVIYIKKINDGEIPLSEKNGKKIPLNDFIQTNIVPSGGYLIGIAMNYLDVHVNRAPIAGKVCILKHIKGLFISLKQKEAVIQNERLFTLIENSYFSIGIVQIASRLVRQIRPFIEEGSRVNIGQKIGMIRFGSQVDLIIPEGKEITIMIKHGEKVRAGESVIAKF